MAEPSQQFTHSDYTVGWICALPDPELVAVMALLDEKHPVLPAADPQDANSYVLGKIGDHNVVIACLPAATTGKVSAATVAKDMIRSFSAVRFGLMVGIGGGAPYYGAQGNNYSERVEQEEDSEDDLEDIQDIRLGDIVVSLHSKSSDAVIQYDFGKSLQEKEFIHTGGKLNKPPGIVLGAVAHLQAQHVLGGHKIPELLLKMASDYPANATKFQHPGSKRDRLFKSDIVHVEGKKSCKTCCGPLDCNLVKRKDRPDNSPRIHYGTIGSADQVMKDAILRDKWARKENIICFEMEAAGLMDSFPCLVIRGICDYADSHKNKMWQPYAAATAASYAKELLLVIPGQGIMNLVPIKQFEKSLKEIHDAVKDTSTVAQSLSHDNRHEKLFAKLSYAQGSSFDASDGEHESRCHPATRVDLLCQIQEWAESQQGESIFWLNGMAGTGKSTISRTLAQNFMQKGQLGASFFFKRGERDRGTAKMFFTTICAQLLVKVPAMIPYIEMAIDTDPYISGKWMKEQFEKLIYQPLAKIQHASPQVMKLVILIDALDECDQEQDIRTILLLLSQFKNLESVNLRVFVTSRPELPIHLGFKKLPADTYQDLILHEIPQPTIERDIAIYLNDEFAKIRDKHNQSRHGWQLPYSWPGPDVMQALVKMTIPLFIFAATVCRFVGDSAFSNPKDQLQKILDYENRLDESEIDKLDATYSPVLNGLIAGQTKKAKISLVDMFRKIIGSIVLLAEPLSCKALACLLDIDSQTIAAILEPLHSVLSIPSSNDSPIQMFHLSFRDFLIDPDKCEKNIFWINDKEIHQNLTIQCVNLMHTNLRKNICDLQSYGTDRRYINPRSIIHHLSPELQYSCRYWMHHLAQSKDPTTHMDKIFTFLQDHFLHWAEVMSILGIIPEVVRAVSILQSLIENDKHSHMSEFLQDARQFMLRNGQIANLAPLQLYASGLIFAPEGSIIRRNFEREIPIWVVRCPVVEKTWGSRQLLEHHSTYKTSSIVFSPDGKLLVSSAADHINLWDPISATLKETLNSLSGFNSSVIFSPDGKLLVSYTKNNIDLWDAISATLKETLNSLSGSIHSVIFSPDGKLLVSNTDNNIDLWDPINGTLKQTLNSLSGYICSVIFSPDSKLLVFSSYEDINIWDSINGTLKHTIKGHLDSIYSLFFSPDGTLLMSRSSSGIELWDHINGTLKQTIGLIWSDSSLATFSPDSKLLAYDSYGELRLWDLTNRTEEQSLKGPPFIDSVSFSPDNSLLVSASSDGTIGLWDLIDGTLKHTLGGHPESISSVIFSPDGKLLVSGSWDQTIKIWDPMNGTLKHTLKGHSKHIQSLIFSPDSKILVSSSADETVKLWDPIKGTLKWSLNVPGHITSSFASRYLVTNQGSINIQSSYNKHPSTTCETNIEVSIQEERWIAIQGTKELWFPFEECKNLAIKDGIVAFPNSFGGVAILEVSTRDA